MSASVDSRIVSMKFDGSQFKRGAAEALGMLDKLKTAMNQHALGRGVLKGAGMASSFANMINPINLARRAIGLLQGDAAKFTMKGPDEAVGRVSKSFLALSTIGVAALGTLTAKATSAATAWVKSFTVGPILDGLHEYETNLKSIQTIQANTDRPLPVINKALQELNRYSDQTIYNFSEMAKNIGTFTAAGVGLKDATASIKGIANMAALSGSSSEQAAGAMYQLSQAIAAGKVGAQDWNSVVNAGMAGKKLQGALATTAIAMGKISGESVKGINNVGKAIKVNGESFKNSIMAAPGKESWLTSDVLVNTLAALDGRFSKAAMSVDTLADGTKRYNSAAEINAQIEKNRTALAAKGVKFTDAQFASLMKLSDAAFKSATEVKTLGQVFDVAKETIGSGWAATFQNIFGNLNEAKTTFTALSNTINGFINRDALARNEALARWKELGGRTALIEGLKNAFKALAAILGPIGQAFRDVFPRKTGEELVSMTEHFRDFMASLIAGEGTMANIRSTFKGVFAIISIGANILSNVIRYFFTLGQLLLGLAGNGGGILSVTGAIGDLLGKIQEWLVQGGKIDDFFTHVIESRAAAFGPIIKAVSELVGWFVKLARTAVGDIFGWVGDHADDIDKLATSFGKLTQSGIDKLKAWFAPIAADAEVLAQKFRELAATKIGEAFEWLKSLQPYAQHVLELAQAFAKVAGSRIAEFMHAAAGGMDDLGPKLSALVQRIKEFVQNLAGGLDLGSLFDMGDGPSKAEAGINKVKNALSGSTDTADRVRAAWDRVVEVFRRMGEALAPVGDWISQAFADIKAKIADASGHIGIKEVVGAINVGLFAGLLVIFRKFGSQFGSVMEEFKGVLSSGSGVLNQVKDNLKTMQNEVRAEILLKIAIAVGILAASLWVLSKIPGPQLATSLGAVVVMLVILTKTMGALAKQAEGMHAVDAGKMVLLSASMTALGIAMLSMAAAIALFGNMDTGTIVKGLASVAAIMLVMSTSAAMMGGAGGAGLLAASVGILILSAALTALAGAIKLYSMIDVGTLVSGGLKIAGILIGLGLAMSLMSVSLAGAAALFIIAAALTALAPVLLMFANMDGDQVKMMIIGLASAIILLGVAGGVATLVAPGLLALGTAILMIGAGAALAGAGMALFGAGLAVLATTGTAAFAVLAGAVTVFLAMFPFWMQQLALALDALSAVIRNQGPTLVAALGVVLRALLIEVAKSAPALGRAMGALISAGLRVIRTKFPEVVRTGIAVIMALLNGIRQNITRVTTTAIDIVVRFINTVANNMGRIINSGVNLLNKFLTGIANAIPRVAPKATNVVIAFIRAIGQSAQRIVLAGVDMVIKLVNGIANGIRARQGEMNAAGRNLASAVISGMVSGIAGGISAVANAARNLASSALSAARHFLGVRSPSREFMKIGQFSSQGLANGIENYSDRVDSAAEGVARTALDTIAVTMGKINDVVPNNVDLSPRITPILDLTKLQNEATKIGSVLKPGAISADVSFNRAASIEADMRGDDSDDTSEDGGPKEINFTQNNYSPRALSKIEIYRNTKSQINQAKEELSKKS